MGGKAVPSYTSLFIPVDTPPCCVRQLQAKLEEYRARLEKNKNCADTLCKAVMLETLLAKERATPRTVGKRFVFVTCDELKKAFEECGRGDLIHTQDFRNAWSVIHGYTIDGGAHIAGGTGLPEISPSHPSE